MSLWCSLVTKKIEQNLIVSLPEHEVTQSVRAVGVYNVCDGGKSGSLAGVSLERTNHSMCQASSLLLHRSTYSCVDFGECFALILYIHLLLTPDVKNGNNHYNRQGTPLKCSPLM